MEILCNNIPIPVTQWSAKGVKVLSVQGLDVSCAGLYAEILGGPGKSR